MKKLPMFCSIMFVILSAGQSFALPGVYKAGASTMKLNIIGPCETRTISLDGTGFTELLVSGGFLMTNSNEDAVDITDCQCYDGQLTPAVWDAGSLIVFDPIGYPGAVFVAASNLGAGVVPSANILVCDVTFCGVSWGTATIVIDTVPDFDTWIGCSALPCTDWTVYDPNIDAAIINVTATSWHCECAVSGPLEVQAHVSGDPVTATYAASPDSGCYNPPIYFYSDDCVHGSIDPNTGVFTVPAFTIPPEENCTITVTDTANTDFLFGRPTVCTMDIRLLAGFCDCPGNFDHDVDVDGFDAATFKADFGRGEFTRPCIDGDPCNGDFSCDGDVDGTDAAIFKQEFGRSGLINPCPACPRDPWCVY